MGDPKIPDWPAHPSSFGPPSWRYQQDYQQKVRLKDGREVLMRAVRPRDQELILRGLPKLSQESNFHRFFGIRTGFTREELRFLTEVDGVHHYALGAVARDGEGREEGVAISRFIQDQRDPSRAEVAIVILDAFQGVGLGRQLLLALGEAARERGIRTLRGLAHSDNLAMLALARSFGAAIRPSNEGPGVLEIEIPT